MQTSYGYLKKGQEGQVTTDNPVESISLIAEADINFGRAVQRGAKATTMKIIATGGVPVGITGLNLSKAIKYGADTSLIAAKDIGGILREGYIYVIAKAAVKAGDKAYAIPATGEITNIDKDNIALGSSTFEEDGAAGKITALRVKC